MNKPDNYHKPEPVVAQAQTSFPSRATGMVEDWILVGWSKPSSLIALKKCRDKKIKL